MSDVNSQAQTQSSTGQIDANKELEASRQQIAELERAVKGIKADLLSEREKRQQLEAARQNPPTPAGNQVADPVDVLLQKKVVEHATPLIMAAVSYEKAKSFVASKLNVDADEVENTDGWKEVVDFAKRRGISGATPDKTAKLAWQLLQQEKKAEAEAKAATEAERLKAIGSNASISTSTSAAPASSAKQLTNKEIEKMSLAEYAKVRELIAKGEVKIVG